MAIATTRHHSIAQINITPLVDVLLVLLVIFMIAAPVLTHDIRLDLPQAAPPAPDRPAVVGLRIDAAGDLHWNNAPVALSALPGLMADHGEGARKPKLVIDASADADYGVVAKVLAAANNARWDKVEFAR